MSKSCRNMRGEIRTESPSIDFYSSLCFPPFFLVPTPQVSVQVSEHLITSFLRPLFAREWWRTFLFAFATLYCKSFTCVCDITVSVLGERFLSLLGRGEFPTRRVSIARRKSFRLLTVLPHRFVNVSCEKASFSAIHNTRVLIFNFYFSLSLPCLRQGQ